MRRFVFSGLVGLLLVWGCAASPPRVQAPQRPLGFPSSCARSGPVVLTSIGDLPPGLLEAVRARYEQVYSLPMTILPSVQRSPESFDAARSQAEAGRLLGDVENAHRSVTDPTAILFALTAEDIYRESIGWRFAFSAFTDRSAVISLARMDPTFFGDAPNPALRDARIYATITRTLGSVYCGLERNDNRESIMAPTLMSVDDLDAMDESVW